MCFIEFWVRLLGITLNFVAMADIRSINVYMMVFLKDDLTLIIIYLLSLGSVEV
jgi:hypothetical protein